jgi:3-dehydroquinate dehydratase-2
VKNILIINGPNLNLLGTRQPEIYGSTTLEDIKALCEKESAANGLKADFVQSNNEGEIVGWIQEASKKYAAIIINAAAYTHTSVAILDALSSQKVPVIEVHLSNIFKREEFRHKSFVSPAAVGIISGFGADSYRLAIQAATKLV